MKANPARALPADVLHSPVAQLVAFPPQNREEAALFAKGAGFALWQTALHALAEKKFGSDILHSHIDWLLLALLLHHECQQRATSLSDLLEALAKRGSQLPARPTLRKIFDRFEAHGLIRLKQQVGRTKLYAPTRKLQQQAGRLAIAAPSPPDAPRSRKNRRGE